MLSDDNLLEKCRGIIETKTGWGPGQSWSNNDFNELSEQIYAVTQVSLSPTTLKRVWGRVKYDSAPHPATLDVLARFAGFEHWRAFKLQHARQPAPAHLAKVRLPKRLIPFFALTFIVGGILLLIGRTGWAPAVAGPDAYTFAARTVTKGVPNSVVFHFDASAARPGDSVFIQQSWDKRKRIPVTRGAKEHTAMYYYPGFYKAKLVVNDDTMKEQDILIPTDGWIGLIEHQPTPIYLQQADFEKDGELNITAETVTNRQVSLQPDLPSVDLFNVSDFKGLKSDHFFFETELRNNYKEGSAVCQFSEIILLFRHDVWVIPLSAPGCVAELKLHAGRKDFIATYTDLSGFGCDLSEWTRVRVESKGHHMVILVNGKEVFQYQVEVDAAEVIGVRYRFDGAGGVRNVVWGRF